MGKLSKKLLKKGVDGFFIDNCDVYDYAKTKKNFKGLAKILKNIKRLGKDVMINGGDVFVTKYRKIIRIGEEYHDCCQSGICVEQYSV